MVKKKTAKAVLVDKEQQFTSMMDALDFIDSLKRRRKIEGNLHTRFSVTWKEPVKKP